MSGLIWKAEKVVAFKTESVYGTDPVPTGAANAMLLQNFKWETMAGEDVARPNERPYFGADATLPAGIHVKTSFEFEAAPSGTAGTAPPWAAILLACGLSQTVSAGVSVTLAPAATPHASGTMYFWMGDIRHAATGMRGTAKRMLTANGVPRWAVEMTGLFVQPTTVTRPAATLTPWQVPQIVQPGNTPTMTWNGVALAVKSFEFDFGNTVIFRQLINSSAVLITDRKESLKLRCNATGLPTFNPYSLSAAATVAALSLVHGVGAGKISTFAVPNALLQRVQGLEDDDGIAAWDLSFVPLPGSGNDQWSEVLT